MSSSPPIIAVILSFQVCTSLVLTVITEAPSGHGVWQTLTSSIRTSTARLLDNSSQTQGVGQCLRLCNCHAPKMHSNVSFEPSPQSLAMYKTSLNTASSSVPAIPCLPNTFLPLTVVKKPANSHEFVANSFYASIIVYV